MTSKSKNIATIATSFAAGAAALFAVQTLKDPVPTNYNMQACKAFEGIDSKTPVAEVRLRGSKNDSDQYTSDVLVYKYDAKGKHLVSADNNILEPAQALSKMQLACDKAFEAAKNTPKEAQFGKTYISGSMSSAENHAVVALAKQMSRNF